MRRPKTLKYPLLNIIGGRQSPLEGIGDLWDAGAASAGSKAGQQHHGERLVGWPRGRSRQHASFISASNRGPKKRRKSPGYFSEPERRESSDSAKSANSNYPTANTVSCDPPVFGLLLCHPFCFAEFWSMIVCAGALVYITVRNIVKLGSILPARIKL